MKKKSEDENEDFAALLEEHLQKHPTISKQEESNQVHRNKAAPKKSDMSSVDLHGMSLHDAKSHLRNIWNQLQHSPGRKSLRIITGKGIHSGATGPVLVEEIYDFCIRLFGKAVVRIDQDPAKVKLSGLPLRGHFDVDLQIKKG